MERPIFKPIGTLAEQLDTPSLVVDTTILERNINKMASFFDKQTAKLRPHVESHLCPTIARKQLEAGGTVDGIGVTTLGQAEVFAGSGFTNIFISNIIVTHQKIARLCALARQTSITLAVADVTNVKNLASAATQSGARLSALVAVHERPTQCVFESKVPVTELVTEISKSNGLDFAGLMTCDHKTSQESSNVDLGKPEESTQLLLDTRNVIESAGMEVRTVRAGTMYNYETVGSLEGITEVPVSLYALMDYRHSSSTTNFNFEPAAHILSSVTSVPEPGKIITDCGQKAIGADTGFPGIDNVVGATVSSLSAEHGTIDIDTNLIPDMNLEDKLQMIPWDIGGCVNLHDYINVIRDGKLEAVWEVSARGHYR